MTAKELKVTALWYASWRPNKALVFYLGALVGLIALSIVYGYFENEALCSTYSILGLPTEMRLDGCYVQLRGVWSKASCL